MTHVESFEAGGFAIESHQGQFNDGPFIRYFEFLMRPLAGGLPISLAISRDNLDLGLDEGHKI